MSKLPLLAWREVVKALGKVGFKIVRQKGSDIILVKDERIVPIPKHAEIIMRQSLSRQASYRNIE